ncbi:type 4b pilus protein PilO2 [Pseudomonas sp. UMAB-40]|uniref:type 4b pilus protein PilO2 n=1 Tax=Pseudomonas sp. UMAB-40 TaxID=1365407 RepID=UPI001C5824A2|nr:type 4b pilus protein PilO2 [Pseudomonas sp. UMAB-40]
MTDAYIEQLTPNAWLVFGGIKWKPLIGSGLPGKSQKEAVAVKATHFVSAGAHSAAVGTIQLPDEKNNKIARKLYSAAAMFALSHQTGAMIAKEKIHDGRYWVVGCHDGMVSKGTDVVCSAAEADEIVADFKSRHSSALEVSGTDAELAHYLNVNTELQPVKSAIEKLPKPVKIGVCLLLCLMLVDTGLGYWKKYQLRKMREQNIEQFVDARAEWANALDDWAKTVKIDGQPGLKGVYDAMGRIPMVIGRWQLFESECVPTSKGWYCAAKYRRTVEATNYTFKTNLPEGWVAKWDGLSTAIGSWEITAPRKPLARPAISPLAQFSVNYISQLQRVLFSYRIVDLLPPVKVVIPNPTVVQVSQGRSEQIPIPYPQDNLKGIEIPSKQSFTFKGPLRSLSVLPLVDETVIKSLKFEVEMRAVSPSLRDSVFMTTLTGEFYVQ